MSKWYAEHKNGFTTENETHFNDLEDITKLGIGDDYVTKDFFLIDGKKITFNTDFKKFIQFKRAYTDFYKGKRISKIISRNFGFKGDYKVILSLGDKKLLKIEADTTKDIIIEIDGKEKNLGNPNGKGMIILDTESGELDV